MLAVIVNGAVVQDIVRDGRSDDKVMVIDYDGRDGTQGIDVWGTGGDYLGKAHVSIRPVGTSTIDLARLRRELEDKKSLKVGDRVKIINGNYAGMEGIILEPKIYENTEKAAIAVHNGWAWSICFIKHQWFTRLETDKD